MEEQPVTKKGMSMNPLLIVVVILLLLGGGWWMLTKNSAKQPAQQSPAPTAMDSMSGQDMKESPTGAMMESTTVSPAADATGVKNVTVEGKNFSFAPSQIMVKKGDKVKITFKNTGGFHNWTLDYNGEKYATKSIQADQTETVEFTADTAGTFDYYCSVGNHRQMGMKGTLIVQ